MLADKPCLSASVSAPLRVSLGIYPIVLKTEHFLPDARLRCVRMMWWTRIGLGQASGEAGGGRFDFGDRPKSLLIVYSVIRRKVKIIFRQCDRPHFIAIKAQTMASFGKPLRPVAARGSVKSKLLKSLS